MKKSLKSGFTVLELVVVIAVLGVALVVGMVQKQNLDAMARDDVRKTAINAMYYALEEGFYPANGYYPQSISEDNLKMIDPELFTDPDGVVMGGEDADYRYSVADCDSNGHCKEYTLRAKMEKEDIYIKKSRSH